MEFIKIKLNVIISKNNKKTKCQLNYIIYCIECISQLVLIEDIIL